ncbi:predicted protein [Chaetomium globosum CBS 148.51]|uniref:Uncharacterized protein n=1 Tax=Chaetomium globosum (strain ATCC 6205 / CBS 148.51 / DSM 1962 / NBRC 6347 / NRRL 1970) TaxID=306901 RepID=Q2H690_CHAGB|nr:uncharacterized protein CHGG_05825 [Chaetomium globosum CBS 148.51]EAQ89206.1 predicted protein [Chaetomium globosum CBS 148.51]
MAIYLKWPENQGQDSGSFLRVQQNHKCDSPW